MAVLLQVCVCKKQTLNKGKIVACSHGRWTSLKSGVGRGVLLFFFAELSRTLYDGDGAPLPPEKAERAGTAQPAEQEAQGHLHVQRHLKGGQGSRARLRPWRPEPGQEALGTNRSTRGSVWAPGALLCGVATEHRQPETRALLLGYPEAPRRGARRRVSALQQGWARRARRAFPASAARGP